MQAVLMIKNRSWKAFPLLLLTALLLFAAGCGQTITSREKANNNLESEEEGTGMSQEHSALEKGKPPLDSRVPEKLETATFALG